MNTRQARGRGRPRLDPTGAPSLALKVRITQAEKAALEALAAALGCSESEALRRGLRRLVEATTKALARKARAS